MLKTYQEKKMLPDFYRYHRFKKRETSWRDILLQIQYVLEKGYTRAKDKFGENFLVRRSGIENFRQQTYEAKITPPIDLVCPDCKKIPLYYKNNDGRKIRFAVKR